MNSRFLLATVCDFRDVDSAKQFFYAAVAYGHWPGSLMLVCRGLDPDVVEWFESRGILVQCCEPVVPDEIWTRHRGISKVGPAAVLKMNLFGTEFRKWDTVVYMDTDILIRGPIDELSKLQGFHAVPDELSVLRQHFKPEWLKIKNPPRHLAQAPAFNSGVIVFSPKSLPENIHHDLISTLVENVDCMVFTDQSVLNLVFCRKWKRLPSNYNLLINMVAPHASRREDSQIRRARVLHFAGYEPEHKPSSKRNVFHRRWSENLLAAESHEDFGLIPRKPPRACISDARMSLILAAVNLRKRGRKWLRNKYVKGFCRKFNRCVNLPLSLLNPAYRIQLQSVNRQPRQAIITGDNVNGPSVIRVPAWIHKPLGKYYMYFGDHGGDRIHLAYADDLNGPWNLHEPGTLQLDDADWFEDHIASPDVHVDDQEQRIRMYFHGPAKFREGQWTGLAFSSDGLNFKQEPVYLGKFYFRVFQHEGWYYAISKDWNEGWSRLYRSKDGVTEFEEGPRILKNSRHTAVSKDGNILMVYYSRIGDAPEQIFLSFIRLDNQWHLWRDQRCIPVLKPEARYEGIEYPLQFSKHGSAVMVRQLRDPFVYTEGDQVHLFYSFGGEMGIAKASLQLKQIKLIPNSIQLAIQHMLINWLKLPKSIADLVRLVCSHGLSPKVRQLCRLYPRPIILGGCGRSGTTLLLSVLSCHPSIHVIDGENAWFCPTAYSAKPDYTTQFRTQSFMEEMLKLPISSGKTHWCEKTPKNVRFFARILEYFGENCRIIHIVRDGRDVVTSKHPNQPDKYWIDIQRWVDDTRAGLELGDKPQVLTIHYEDLVFKFDEITHKICQFLGIPYSKGLRQFPEKACIATLEKVTMGHAVEKIHGMSVGRWKESQHASVIKDFYEHPQAVELLESLGYDAKS